MKSRVSFHGHWLVNVAILHTENLVNDVYFKHSVFPAGKIHILLD